MSSVEYIKLLYCAIGALKNAHYSISSSENESQAQQRCFEILLSNKIQPPADSPVEFYNLIKGLFSNAPISDNPAIDKNDSIPALEFINRFSHALWAIEKNGDPKEHAEKLYWLFSTPEKMLEGLNQYAESVVNIHATKVVHDLCMHIKYPPNKVTNFPLWIWSSPIKALIFKSNGSNHLELLTEFYPLFLLHLDEKSKTINPSAEYKRGEMQQLEKLLTATEDKKNSIYKKLIALYSWEEIHSIIYKKELEIDFANLTDNEKQIAISAMKINQRFKRPSSEGVSEIIQWMGIAQNSDTHLPSLLLKSEEIGFPPGFYMTKMLKKDVRAAYFGHFTGCCQRVTAAGSSCAMHSITSPNGGLYAIFQAKKIADGKTSVNLLHDKIIAGSWAWYSSESNAIVFDSLEMDDPSINENIFSEEKLTKFYSHFAALLREAAKVNIVLIGTHGNTPDSIGIPPLFITEMGNFFADDYPRDGYRDSKNTRVLSAAGEREPWYKISDDPEELLAELAAKYIFIPRTKMKFSSGYFSSPELTENVSDLAAFAFLMKYFKVSIKNNLLTQWITGQKLLIDNVIAGNVAINENALLSESLNLSSVMYVGKTYKTLLVHLIQKQALWAIILHQDQLTKALLDTGDERQSAMVALVKEFFAKPPEDRSRKLPRGAAQKYMSAHEEFQILLKLFIEKNGDVNLGDVHSNAFVHYFFMNYAANFGEDVFFDGEQILLWIEQYEWNLALRNDRGITPALLILRNKKEYPQSLVDRAKGIIKNDISMLITGQDWAAFLEGQPEHDILFFMPLLDELRKTSDADDIAALYCILPREKRNEFLDNHLSSIDRFFGTAHEIILSQLPEEMRLPFIEKIKFKPSTDVIKKIIVHLPLSTRWHYLQKNIGMILSTDICTDILYFAPLLPVEHRLSFFQDLHIEELRFDDTEKQIIANLISPLPTDDIVEFIERTVSEIALYENRKPRIWNFISLFSNVLSDKLKDSFIKKFKVYAIEIGVIHLLKFSPVSQKAALFDEFFPKTDLYVRTELLKVRLSSIPAEDHIAFLNKYSDQITFFELIEWLALLPPPARRDFFTQQARYKKPDFSRDKKGSHFLEDAQGRTPCAQKITTLLGLLPPEIRFDFAKNTLMEFCTADAPHLFSTILKNLLPNEKLRWIKSFPLNELLKIITAPATAWMPEYIHYKSQGVTQIVMLSRVTNALEVTDRQEFFEHLGYENLKAWVASITKPDDPLINYSHYGPMTFKFASESDRLSKDAYDSLSAFFKEQEKNLLNSSKSHGPSSS